MVTGGQGFIGNKLVKRLEKIGKVVNIDKKSMVNGLCNDIRGNLEKEMKDVDYIFHLAALHLPKDIKNISELYSVNVEGTRRLLDHAKRFNVKKIIFSSSAAVYGDGNGPINHYGMTKKMSEDLIDFYNLDATILRYFNVYGDGGYGLINKLIQDKKYGNRPLIFGDGNNRRDYIHVDDVVEANLISISESGVYNVGTGITYSPNELCKMLKLNPIYVDSDSEIKNSKSTGPYLKNWKPNNNLEDEIRR